MFFREWFENIGPDHLAGIATIAEDQPFIVIPLSESPNCTM